MEAIAEALSVATTMLPETVEAAFDRDASTATRTIAWLVLSLWALVTVGAVVALCLAFKRV